MLETHVDMNAPGKRLRRFLVATETEKATKPPFLASDFLTHGRSQLGWYLNRLRCMTPAEILFRAMQALAVRAERRGLRGVERCPAADLAAVSRPWLHLPSSVDAPLYVAAADRIVAGRIDVFALQDVELGSPPRWNRDPKTGIDAPLQFGLMLDYRDARVVGNIKYLWEVNRHLHLVTLAQAYALTSDPQYVAVIRAHLESWFIACPHRMGPNWSSALEAALRLINWSAVWHLLGGTHARICADAEGAAFRRRWLESVYRHAHFIRAHFSLYSSANNHLIGEAAGLFIAALTWPVWPDSRRWRAEAAAILERETLLQNAPDGVNREQAVSYQQFELDLLLLPLLAGRANGHEFSAAYAARIEKMIEFLASIMDGRGHVPMFGDSDDGVVLKLAPQPDFCGYRSLLATGAVLFRRCDFKAKAGALDDKTRWLLGPAAVAYRQLEHVWTRLPPKRVFPVGGYYILGCDFETDAEIRLVVDAGPLGYQTIAAHGHADALAFTLSVGGREFLIDPGTYAYHTDPAWRRYFRGTAAHNTVCVDGCDQSQSGGNFMWLHKTDAECSVCRIEPELDVFEGWHDGYRRLPDPVVHSRRIVLDKRSRRIVIEDTLQMSGQHDVEIFFHCSELCRVDRIFDGYAIARGNRTLLLKLPPLAGAQTQIHLGSEMPVSGWVARRFDEKRASPTIAWRARLAKNTVLCSELRC